MAQRLAHAGGLSLPHPITEFGGMALVAGVALDARADRLIPELKKWSTVADVMQMLVDIHHADLNLSGGASVSKAIELCADDPHGRSVGQTRRLWGEFREVAHLLTAGALLARSVPESDGSIFSAAWFAPDSLLAIAAGLQIFGLDFLPHGQEEPSLPSETTWRLSSRSMPNKPWLQYRALSERQKQVLADFKAKKTYGKD